MSDSDDLVARARRWLADWAHTPGMKSQLVRQLADRVEALEGERKPVRCGSYLKPCPCCGAEA